MPSCFFKLAEALSVVFNLSREVYKKFKRIADRNGWKDFNKLEEKQEIVRYMMEKEDTKMTTY